ncbi:MAG: tRNA threonylcarbamoyladenosine dehydratase [Victivallaceae bacterium]|nr:tRNA threonylcarbamoyladenosine dehydratase [Victivallaceae bacterium]
MTDNTEELERTSRTRLLLGDEAVERLRRAHVLVLGVGGVGGYAAELLVRAGVGAITIADGDRFELSNCNRQLHALISTVGQPKVEVLRQRFSQINPDCQVHAVFDFIENEKADALLDRANYDWAVDAIDSLSAKVWFLVKCRSRNLGVTSSMGSGGKMDPTRVRVVDLSETFADPLARCVRKLLRRHGIERGIETVFSAEEIPGDAVRPGEGRSVIGTLGCVPAAFGCALAGAVLKHLLADRTVLPKVEERLPR